MAMTRGLRTPIPERCVVVGGSNVAKRPSPPARRGYSALICRLASPGCGMTSIPKRFQSCNFPRKSARSLAAYPERDWHEDLAALAHCGIVGSARRRHVELLPQL